MINSVEFCTKIHVQFQETELNSVIKQFSQ